jgi:hypothetical protein
MDAYRAEDLERYDAALLRAMLVGIRSMRRY